MSLDELIDALVEAKDGGAEVVYIQDAVNSGVNLAVVSVEVDEEGDVIILAS
jgi:hypothetical protein